MKAKQIWGCRVKRAHRSRICNGKKLIWFEPWLFWTCMMWVSSRASFFAFCEVAWSETRQPNHFVCKSNWEQSKIHWIWHDSKCHPVDSAVCQTAVQGHPAAVGVSLTLTLVSDYCRSIRQWLSIWKMFKGNHRTKYADLSVLVNLVWIFYLIIWELPLCLHLCCVSLSCVLLGFLSVKLFLYLSVVSSKSQ